MSEMRSYYAIIPAYVRYDEDLPPNAKLLYGEITALTNEKGYCWATNSYFSNLYNVTNVSVSNWITKLEEKGYIKREMVRGDNKEIKQRRIFLADPIKNNFNTPQKNVYEGIKENFNTSPKNLYDPIKENFKENNTLNTTVNTTLNNTTKETVLSLIDEFSNQNQELKEALLGFKEMREKKKAPLTVRAMKMAITSLEKLSLDYREQVEIIDQSTMNSWNGFYALKKEKTGKNSQEEYFEFLDQWAMEGEE